MGKTSYRRIVICVSKLTQPVSYRCKQRDLCGNDWQSTPQRCRYKIARR